MTVQRVYWIDDDTWTYLSCYFERMHYLAMEAIENGELSKEKLFVNKKVPITIPGYRDEFIELNGKELYEKSGEEILSSLVERGELILTPEDDLERGVKFEIEKDFDSAAECKINAPYNNKTLH